MCAGRSSGRVAVFLERDPNDYLCRFCPNGLFNAGKPLFMMGIVAKGWRLQALRPGTTGPGVVRFSLDKYYLVKIVVGAMMLKSSLKV